MAQEFLLRNKSNNKTFRFRIITDIRNRISQPVNTVSLINSNWSNALHFKMFGQTRTIQLRFALVDDTVDVADGTHSHTVTTLDQQVEYLQEDVYQAQFDGEYELYAVNGSLLRYFPSDGVVVELEVEETKGLMKIATGSITFTFGQVNPLG